MHLLSQRNTTIHHYKLIYLILFKEIITVYSEKNIKPLNTLYDRIAER
jgi:hypothetical protein